MGSMVVGIFPNHDCLVNLTQALQSNGFRVDRLRVISNDTPAEHLARTGVQFVFSGEAESSAIGRGSSIITSSGGTGVPGLTDHNPDFSLHSEPSIEELLIDFDIPGARWEDYSQALDAGRSVAGYNPGADTEKMKALFSAAGGYPVEVF